MAAAAHSFECIDSALGMLQDNYYMYMIWHTRGQTVDDCLFFKIQQIKADWELLKMLWELLRKWSTAVDVIVRQNLESLVLKIEAAADNFGRICVEMNRNPGHKLFESAVEVQRRSDYLIVTEIRGTFQDWWSSCCSFPVHSPPDDHSFWTSFVDSVMLNLLSVGLCCSDDCNYLDQSIAKRVSAFYREVKFLRGYIIFAVQLPKSVDVHGHEEVDDFLNHFASVIVCSAIEFCNYWFNQKIPELRELEKGLFDARLKDLQHEIDPKNPKFMDFYLKSIIALIKIANLRPISRLTACEVHFTGYFCSFLPRNEDFKNEVRSLVTPFFNIQLEQQVDSDVVQCFFAEISELLVEIRQETSRTSHPRLELLQKICFLKAELLLMEQLLYHKTTFSDGGLDGILENLRKFSEDLPQEKIEYEDQRLVLTQQLSMEVASLRQSFEAKKKITKSMVKNSLHRFLLKLVILKAESFLSELLLLKSQKAATFMAYEKVQIEFLLEQLKLLNLILINQIIEDTAGVEMTFKPIEKFARRITSFSYSFRPDEIPKDMIMEMTLSFFELLDCANHIRPKLKEIGPQLQLPNFPKTYNVGFIVFLVKNLGELLKYDPESISPVKHHIKEIQQHLELLSSFLVKVSESDIEHPELKDLGNHVINIAYKVEFVVDSIETDAQWQHFFWFYDLLEQLRLVDKQAFQIHETIGDDKVQSVTQVSADMISRGRRPTIDKIMVELRDEEEVILDQLTRGSSQLDIVSIVGMPGIGKTTMARKVYSNQQVIYHFHRRAWCTVSQVYEKRKLLIEILRDIHGLTNEIHQMSEEDLELKLRQCLLKNKYLIVMDDVWDVGAWNDLVNSFPDDVNGSRILITSRLHDVVSEIKPNVDPHTLRPFSDDESWELLERKIFQDEDEGCPDELLLVGKEIAQQCKGLPLAVVAIAGLLQKTEKRKEWWEKMAETLSSEIMKDPDARCLEILELSYKHLPGYLKPCFLYLGGFIEDKDIPVSKLLRFWLAEGFIQRTESKSLEDAAEDHLMDLINRSLVIISKRRSNGKVKACRLHDLIRDLCQSKAKEGNFLQLVTRFDEPYASFPISDYGFEYDFDELLESVSYGAYRLSILLKRNQFFELRPSGLGTRSLIFFASTDLEPRCPYDISFICHNFKLLRVLDIECINMGVSFPVEIGILTRLRYLAISGYVRSIPESISNLRNLQTLIVKGLRGKVVLPGTIWYMTTLRHLHVNNHVAFNLDHEELGERCLLENLVSFSCPSLRCGEDAEKMMKRFPNLCKLRCVFLQSRDPSRCKQFPRLNCLTLLESLNISYNGRAPNTSELILPSNLKKLTLSNFHLPWAHISAIGRLPNLQVLKLVSGAFEGKIWDMKEEEFQELIFLKLDSLNIVQWNASCDHLPKLQHLVIQNCKDLQNVPYDFEDITSLDMIEVLRCGQSAEESANEIGEATGNISVLISHL